MNYGYFDDKNAEYVITRPDTPRPWSNYLGSTEYGAIITNHSGGYSFYKSAARGRFTRLYFNAVPIYMPGRLFYLRDDASGDFWSSAWLPVTKPLSKYKYECRHGTAYTTIKSRYSGIATETAYFVPLGRNFECWIIKVKNMTKKPRDLSVWNYVEYAGDWTVREDLIDLQFAQYVIKSDMVDGILNTGYLRYLGSDLEGVTTPDQGRNSFLTIVGADVAGYDTRREDFLGPYGTYANPAVVVSGKPNNTLSHGDNACAAMQVKLHLEPGEEREFMVLMGVGSAERWGKPVRAEFNSVAMARAELEKVKAHWHAQLGTFMTKTPDADFDSTVNVWGAYNCLITYAWSRAASLVYQGERDGLGYRDTVQDLLGVAGLIPEEGQKRLELMLTGQMANGGAITVIKPFAHHPGQMKSDGHYRSDDCQWLFNTVPEYVKETGNLAFYDKVLPYADSGSATVLGHLRQAIEFNLARMGKNGLPTGADWNDCLGLSNGGETIFVTFQLRYALTVYMDITERLNRPEETAWAHANLATLDAAIAKICWDGKWWRRGIHANGNMLGTKERAEGSIFLEPQPWAVIANAGTRAQQTTALDSVHEMLATEHGIMLCAPPFRQDKSCGAVLYNAGQKENCGIFQHPQGWVVIAEAMLGRGDRAYEYFRAYMPAASNDKAEVREAEPYVWCQSTHGKFSRLFGKARLPWLSGTASWSYYAATHYILGIQPDYEGLRVNPCIPAKWDGFKVTRQFRGATYEITVKNPSHLCAGVLQMKVDGKTIKGNLIAAAPAGAKVKVVVTLESASAPAAKDATGALAAAGA